MRKKVFSVIVLIALLLSVITVKTASASGKTIGFTVDTGSGLRGIVSTMVGTGNPPAFQFTSKNPDSYQLFFSSQIRPLNSCLQAEVYHEKLSGASTTYHVFQFYNWCSGNPIAYAAYLTDPTFRSKYVRTNTWNDTGFAFQDENMDVRIYNWSGGWYGQAYNYNTLSWDTLAYNGGSVSSPSYIDFGDGGATQDSPGAYCPTLYPWGIAQIRGIQKYNGSTWSTISSSDINSSWSDFMYCFNNGTYVKKTPNAWQFKIVPQGTSY